MTTFFKNALNGTNNITVCIPINYYALFMHILLPKVVPLPPAIYRAWSPDFPAHCCRKKCPSWTYSYTILFHFKLFSYNQNPLKVHKYIKTVLYIILPLLSTSCKVE